MTAPHPKKVLVMKLRALGDTVLLTAPLAELRRAWPRAEIHVAVTSTWAPLLEHHPAIDKIWRYDRFEDRAARAKAVMRLAFKLRREHFDCVVNLHASPSSATISFATGAPRRSIHFHGHKDRNRHSTVTIADKGIVKPIIERDMDAVRALDISVPTGRLPRLYVLEQERKNARERLLIASPRPLLMIGLGASRPAKAWPLERFAELAVDWAMSPEAGSSLAIAGPAEESLVTGFLKSVDTLLETRVADRSLRASIRARIHGKHTLSLRELAATLTWAAVFVGNDSGPKHIAVAVGCPTVTIFGPEHPLEWHPYPVDQHPYLFVDQLACRPTHPNGSMPAPPPWCGVHDCLVTSPEQHRCMRMITVEQIMAECRRVTREGSFS
jgi:ADP-heptose:LPS heptosyltransferase